MMTRPLAAGAAGLILSLAALSTRPATPADHVVSVSGGKVEGSSEPNSEVVAFKGIPYAAPPVGSLRWRAPQSGSPWSGIRNATHFGADCMQTPYVISTGQQTSEDCLTVNVWTPALHGNAQRPVMVFIYGGGFIGGSAAYPLYDGALLASAGVVVVSFNYRVGIFGFLAHPQLSEESVHKSSGNYGLMDQIAALEWVKENIAGFGGDPRRVTVFGESAGAVSIALLMTSPLAKGLFQGAILQSAVVLPLARLSEAERSGAKLNANIEVLRKMSAEQLLAHNGDFFPSSRLSLMAMSFPSPIVDGHVLPEQPRGVFNAGRRCTAPPLDHQPEMSYACHKGAGAAQQGLFAGSARGGAAKAQSGTGAVSVRPDAERSPGRDLGETGESATQGPASARGTEERAYPWGGYERRIRVVDVGRRDDQDSDKGEFMLCGIMRVIVWVPRRMHACIPDFTASTTTA